MESAPAGAASSLSTINNNNRVSDFPAPETTLEQLFSSRSLKVTVDDGVPVAVISVQRYLSEKVFCNDQPHDPHDSYTYDVTVTDGVWRTRGVLHRSLNRLVHCNTLRPGVQIRITGCSFVYNEQRLGQGHICIEKVQCDAGARSSPFLDGLKDLGCLSVLTKHGMENVGVRDDFPLKTSSKHYLPLWNNEDPEGEQWLPPRTTPDLVLDVSSVTLLCDLESSLGYARGGPPLLVRVIHKSRLRYYGKCDIVDAKKKADYPYHAVLPPCVQAYLEVADQSGAMSLVLWSELCLDWYHSLHVGAVLYIHKYTVKDSYANRSRPQMEHHCLRVFRSKEISLNRRSTAPVLSVVPQKNLPVQWGLPDVAYRFTCRSELENLAPNTACDVIGLVTFVGRVQRIRCQGDKGPEKFWTYRWVHALDGSSQRPFILEIFSCSQPDVFHAICPMTYLVCTQMRVCPGASAPFLTSSCETQIFITGHHRGQPYVSDPRVKEFIRWTKTLKDGAVLDKTLVGGHYCYPPAPPVFTQPLHNGSVPVVLVAASDLKGALESLRYREHKRLAVQGLITAVRYVRLHPDPSEPNPDPSEPSGGEGSGEASAGTSRASTATSASEHRDVGHTKNGTGGGTAPSGVASPSITRRTTPKKRSFHRFYLTRAKMRTKRLAGGPVSPDTPEVSSSGSDSDLLDAGSTLQEGSVEPPLPDPAEQSPPLRWESRDWSRQRGEVSTHLCGEGLQPDTLARRFSLEERSALLAWSGLPSSHWTPPDPQPGRTAPPGAGAPGAGVPGGRPPGYYHTTILGINQQVALDAAFCPVVSSADPRAEGLPLDPHGNSLLSLLSAGFLCPLGDPVTPDLPSPEEVLQTAGELEGAHLLCVLDLCHLGGDRVEVLLSKVYRVT
ncbi:RPA-related protein RADX isoform X2 [Gadus morhua]|uniref:RPA-related protein RADX isoform X2 n=1 Tax=Gadus morhua TaxID=8049 RepID=UPI0011B67DEC|nr:RPA-related protein RADX isoform X2 [Gadus morhua]